MEYAKQALVCLLALVAITSAQVVNTKYGKVNGFTTETHKIWKGIPFAEPPVGNLRWRPPRDPTPWSGVKNTQAFGAYCPQNFGGAFIGSEDCLTINVWVPKNADLSKPELAVLAYVYGGSFTGGSSADFEGDFLSGEDVIYVNFNYRVGALGGLYHPALVEESGGTSGFYGIQDQRLAFKWIRENIAAFGGNPNRVTISSESAGSIAMCIHTVAPRSKGLYDQIISQSGYCNSFTQAQGTQVGNLIASRLNCSGDNVLSCLRAATPIQLRDASNGIPVFYYTSHPYEIVDTPVTQLYKGNFNAVPIMGGTNLNESSYTMCGAFGGYTFDQLVAYANANYLPHLNDKNLTSFLEVYDRSEYPTVVSNMIAMGSDRSFRCGTYAWFRAFAKLVPTYMYSFEVDTPSFAPSPCYGAAHAYDLHFLYANYGPGLTETERALAHKMREGWVSFAKNGRPTVTGATWPAYTLASGEYIKFDIDAISTGSHWREEYCPLWNLTSLNGVGVSIPAVAPEYPSATNAPTSPPTTPPCAGATFDQVKTGSWQSNGKTVSQFQVTIRVGAQPLYSVEIALEGTITNVWNLNRVGDSNIYTISDWQYQNGALPAGSSSASFGYIVESDNEAPISFNGNPCKSSKVCSVSVLATQTNSWVSGSQTYTQYQLTVRNGSPSTVASTTFDVTFTGGAYITDSWNIAPSTSTPSETTKTFSCSTNNLSSGASYTGCGFTLAVPSSNAFAPNQRVVINQATCL